MADPEHRQSTTRKKPKQNINKTANSGEWGELDFQSCHIIRSKCAVFNNNKNPHGIQRNRKLWPIQKKNQQKLSLKKDLTADLLDKDFKTVLKKT